MNAKNIKTPNRQGYSPDLFIERISSSPAKQNTAAMLMILVFAIINVLSIMRGFSLTTDEDKHYLYGQRVISGDSTRFDDSKMPVTALNALPQKLSAIFEDGKLRQLLARFYMARMVTVFVSCMLAFLVFHWSRLLYGFVPGLVSLALYILDPNIIAHSQLVTTDLYVICTITFSFFFLWKFANERNFHNGLACLVLLGISQLAKYTAIVLYPLFLIAIITSDVLKHRKTYPNKGFLKTSILQYARFIILALVVSVIVINLGFLFNHTFTQFGDYQFRSGLFNNLQGQLPILNNLHIPVPYPYLQGLDAMLSTEQTGNFSGNIYFMGRTSSLKGFPGYYFVASLLKVPISTQIIVWLALILYFSDRQRRSHLVQNEMFLLVPVLFFTVYFNFFFNTQIGIRYFLPVFPFLYIFSGSLFVGWKNFRRRNWAAVIVLFAYLAVSVFSYYPYHISYFNEFIWDRTRAYKYLADSNLDWDQARNELDQYLAEHPNAIYKPGKVRSGQIVVSVNDLVGVTGDVMQYAWLRENFEPVDTIAYSYLIYEISASDKDRLCATTSYCEE